MKKIILATILLILTAMPSSVFAFEIKNTYPRLANYYLQPLVPKDQYDGLSKFDLLILDVDVQTIDPSLFSYVKDKNNDIKFLAYIPGQSVNTQDLSEWARFRKIVYEKVRNNDWWLYDSQGNIVHFSSVWPTIGFVDPGKGWCDYLSDLAKQDVISRGVWDGIFYDMVFANLSWLNNGDIDINRDGVKDDINSVNNYWRQQMSCLMQQTGEKTNQPVVANVDIVSYYKENLNGTMMENFPAKWLGGDNWSILMNEYLKKLPASNQEPQIYIINANTENDTISDTLKKMRFGLASTLLGDGYYSFDSGDQNHAQTWWYDEYSVNLGQAKTGAYNLLDKESSVIKAGLWRRDFDNGVVLVNSTREEQRYIFSWESFEKIKGTQDQRINDGSKINWIKLAPNDGIILLKTNTEIKDVSYMNGSFVRVFDKNGQQAKNGFFSYKDSYPGSSQVLSSDIDKDENLEILVGEKGKISVFDQGKKIKEFYPYGSGYKKDITFAVADLDGDGAKEIITGAGPGGGPHVRIFSKDGNAVTGGFFAYDKNFRGGVNVAVMDLNGDGTKEIITGAGPGGGPHVRVFSKDGKPVIGGFFAYDKNFRGGVSVATGDVDGDGVKEIMTGAGAGGGSHVKVFSKDGKLINHFLGFEDKLLSGIKVMSDDLDKNGIDEILVSTISF